MGIQESIDTLMTAEELAAITRVKPNTVLNWVHRGRVPYVKVGGSVRFERDAIEAWIVASRKGGDK